MNYQLPNDAALAKKIRDAKVGGCYCRVRITDFNDFMEIGVIVEYVYDCPVHYPETSKALSDVNYRSEVNECAGWELL